MELRLSLERLNVSEKRVKRKKRIFFTDKNENECWGEGNIGWGEREKGREGNREVKFSKLDFSGGRFRPTLQNQMLTIINYDMPINDKYIESFSEATFLHVTCKAVSNVLLFRNDENRRYFLKKYAEYSSGYLETYSYILLNNHVHWLVKTVSEESLSHFLRAIPLIDRKSHQKKYLKKEISFEEAVEFQMKDFFISYAMSYNKRFNRSGALFLNPFRRVKVEDEQHFTQIIVYQHANVMKHGISKDFENYLWSSYGSLLSKKPTILKRSEVLRWFGGRQEFVIIHRELSEYYYSHPNAIE